METGRTLMLNTAGGVGTWIEFPAPFALENVHDDYSSPLLASPDGTRMLELASNYDGPLCKPYFGSGPVASRYPVSHTTRGTGQLEYGGAWKADKDTHFTADPNANVRLRFIGAGVRVDIAGRGPGRFRRRPAAHGVGNVPGESAQAGKAYRDAAPRPGQHPAADGSGG